MTSKSDKDRRKQIKHEFRAKVAKEFKSSLPMTIEIFKQLFDYLDQEQAGSKCADDHSLTRRFLIDMEIGNIDEVLGWLSNHGGYCDCEVLANVEEEFEGL